MIAEPFLLYKQFPRWSKLLKASLFNSLNEGDYESLKVGYTKVSYRKKSKSFNSSKYRKLTLSRINSNRSSRAPSRRKLRSEQFKRLWGGQVISSWLTNSYRNVTGMWAIWSILYGSKSYEYKKPSVKFPADHGSNFRNLRWKFQETCWKISSLA